MTPGDRREPPADAKCSPAAQRKQARSALVYIMSRTVQEGREHFDETLASLNPGTVHNARWLTKANRILRLYVSTLHPSVELIRVVSIIINIYASILVLFQISSLLLSWIK